MRVPPMSFPRKRESRGRLWTPACAGVTKRNEFHSPLQGQWRVRVSGNWRVVFRFEDGEAVDVDLIDYH